MDVWDNRQLEALKAAFSKLTEMSNGPEKEKYLIDIALIPNVDSFDELYDKLNLNYVIKDNGSLTQFPSNSIDFIFIFYFALGFLDHIIL